MAEPKASSVPTDGAGGAPLTKKPSKKVASSGSSSKKVVGSSSDAGADQSANAATAGPSMGSSQLSAAVPTAAVPKLHDVPRIPIAEPKHTVDTGAAPVAATGEAKPRASKKRTATPPSGPDMATTTAAGSGPSVSAAAVSAGSSSGGSAPTVDTAAAAKQAADIEREKQATAARREAKRQRARELEDAKRREALAQQAIEEAKRLEEARVREQRRQQELAALNANAEECQEDDADGDYDDDGFENYDDDAFEDDDRAPEKTASTSAATAKAQMKAKARGPSNNSSDALSPAELRKIQQAMQAESKELSTTSRPSSSSAKAGASAVATAESSNQEQLLSRSAAGDAPRRTSTSIASSIAGLKQALDPRAKRVADVLAARKFEVEKVSLLHHAPLSAHETYANSMRRGHVRQVAVLTSDGARAAATQTKGLAGVDKSMHFPDDIGLDSVAETVSSSGATDGNDDTHSTARFFRFLETAAHACELLAESNAMAADSEREQASATRRAVTSSTVLAHQHVFPTKQFDDPALEQLLCDRELAAMCFSPCVSNILMTCYAPRDDTDASSDKENTRGSSSGSGQRGTLMDKSVGCIWDVNRPHQVLYVLKHEGVVSSACLSPSRELIALAGTEDGCIHVWDLRRQPHRSSSTGSSGNNNSNASPGVIALCSPTYSTCGADYKTVSQHTSTIVALDVIDRTRGHASGSATSSMIDSSGGTFQFGSMDDRGIVIIWSLVEFEAGDDALMADKCVEIGGRVKMVMNTLIDTQQQYMQPKQLASAQRRASSSSSSSTLTSSTLSSKASSAATGAAASSVSTIPVGPIATVFKFFPHDPNQFVVGTCTGRVYHGHRFEKTERSQMHAQYRRRGALAATTAVAVVCIAFHPFALEYFLVGYEDGSVCAAVCVSSWDEVPFGVSVSALQWSTARPGVFFASYSSAQVLVWDLTEQTHAPVFTHAIPALEAAAPVELASSLYPLVLSSETIRTSRPTIAMRCGNSPPFQFVLMELSHELASRSRDEIRDVQALLASII